MHSISSRYRKQKGRPTKRSKAIAAAKSKNASLRNSTPDAVLEESIASTSAATSDSGKYDFRNHNVHSEDNEASGYVLMSEKCFSPLLRNVPCDECGMHSLNVSFGETYGYSTKLLLFCGSCGKDFGATFSSHREPYTRRFDVNEKLVGAFLNAGKGHAAMEKFSIAMEMPTMDRKTFSKCLEKLCSRNATFKENVLQLSQSKIRSAYIECNPSLKNEDILNITVSYDGTWMKRGHTSLYGIGIVIDSLTNLVVDFELMSKHCTECVNTARDLGKDSAEFSIWKEQHEPVCQKNFSGSSGSMEVHAALKLWQRSVQSNKMRYSKMISDGDSKTFQSLCDANIYDDVTITKEECINHVAKRLGTALDNKVKEWRIKKVTLGGKKKGNLSKPVIQKLQNFYRKAITDNAPDIQKMKTAVLATLFHCMSTDAKPQHRKCPTGATSWCFYQRALACKETPKSHLHMKTQLSESVVEKILPVYQRLAADDLLRRCISGKTQNANESLHSLIWNKCPKEVFVSKKRLELCVTLAVSEFNFGCVNTLQLYREKELATPKTETLLLAAKRDHRRLTQFKRRSSEHYKQIRNRKKAKRSQATDGFYGAGAF